MRNPTRKLLGLLLVLCMALGLAAGAGAEVLQLPRNETMYFAGQQWGTINGWNPLSSDNNNAMALADSGGGSRIVMFETLYMYNALDGSMTPLLADGPYQWNDSLTEMTVKIKPAAKWNDGSPLTAHDVAYTWAVGKRIENPSANAFGAYVDTVEAVDDHTLLIKAVLAEDGKPANPLMVLTYIGQAYVAQKAWLEKLEERTGGEAAAMKQDKALDVAFSGPYGPMFDDDTKVIFIRNEEYWGQDASMWGKLPVPKYLGHAMYADNNAALAALVDGQVDVAQLFIANVQDLWLKDGLPISTYIDEAPYGICVNMPTAWFNLNIPGLDNVAVRKAIAIAVDYDEVVANAMTNQSPTFEAVPRSMMNPTPGEQALFDHEAVKDLQWAGKDVEGAKKLLDEAGIVDTDGDGWRELDGKKLSFKVSAPNGWTDWMAAMEIVAAAGKNIGIELVSEFPEWSVYQTYFPNPKQTDLHIFMMWTDSATPAQPWGRVRGFLSSDFVGVEGNWSGNYGQYTNPRADEIIKAIPTTTDRDELIALYTEAVKIYLTDVPSFSLMYRPDKFHTVNESVWTNYPAMDDGRNIPPMNCTDGYGIAALYDMELVEP